MTHFPVAVVLPKGVAPTSGRSARTTSWYLSTATFRTRGEEVLTVTSPLAFDNDTQGSL